MRLVVQQKKQELEAMPVPELRDLCAAQGIKGTLTKPARVEELLTLWHADGGVEKALTKMARDAREATLASMDKEALRKLCQKLGVDPLLKEVMVDRAVRRENELGRFAPPRLEEEVEEPSEPAAKGDMVERLLADQSKRKRELELKKQQEEAAASKREELRSRSADELRRLLEKKGRTAPKKKDEIVDALLEVYTQDQKVAR